MWSKSCWRRLKNVQVGFTHKFIFMASNNIIYIVEVFINIVMIIVWKIWPMIIKSTPIMGTVKTVFFCGLDFSDLIYNVFRIVCEWKYFHFSDEKNPKQNNNGQKKRTLLTILKKGLVKDPDSVSGFTVESSVSTFSLDSLSSCQSYESSFTVNGAWQMPEKPNYQARNSSQLGRYLLIESHILGQNINWFVNWFLVFFVLSSCFVALLSEVISVGQELFFCSITCVIYLIVACILYSLSL